MTTRRGARWSLIASIVGFMMLGIAAPAWAHNVLIESRPGDGDMVEGAPEIVELVFDQRVQPGFNTVTVTGPDGNRWEETSEATVSNDTVSTSLHPLGPEGEYTVGYRVLSADGHTVTGSTTFTLSTAGDGEVPPQPVDESTESAEEGADSGDTGGMPVWPWIAGAALLLVVGVTVAMRLGNDDRSPKK